MATTAGCTSGKLAYRRLAPGRIVTVLLLIGSNVFMTFAWYART
jgi:hypothetical protein